MPKTPIVLEPAQRELQNTSNAPSSNESARRKPSPWNWKKSHKHKDSFALMMDEGMNDMGSSGTKASGPNGPPSVDELKRIAEDIKNGLY